MTQERFSNLTSDSSKQPQRENSQICSPPPHLNVGGHRPAALKTASKALLGVLTFKNASF